MTDQIQTLMNQIEDLKTENAKLRDLTEYSDAIKGDFLYIYKKDKLVAVTNLSILTGMFTKKVGYA